MCLTAQSFGLLLSLVSMNNLTVEEGRVVVHLPDGDVHWLAVGAEWCTGAGAGEFAFDVEPVRVI
ncbi:hypothetical protein KUV51_01940 [Tateyamaria omphalii]|uniref:hypothetical protein n=1 Tax=Tateyamaria omphalii TaxID=299262 RepID=UPI001C993BEC|nr:hypothetical protein [Tateyamaria omphalii]MBY5931746.1 hypothetical protein [Tateyamaria omphalii]